MTPAPVLVVVTDFEHVAFETLLSRIELVCTRARAATIAVQLRDHGLSARTRFEHGKRLRELTRRFGQYLVVNDRVDLALALDADGVHLGELSVDSADARKLVSNKWLSRAAHAPAALDDVDAIVLAPIFASRHGRDALGLDAIVAGRKLSRAPLYALGGVDASNAQSAIAAGAQGVALMGALHGDTDALLSALGIAS